jgi:MHS family proline/betaine transporter-like MFS transporter
MSKRKIKPLEIDDVEIVDYEKTKKAIKAAALVMQLNGSILVYMAMLPMYWVKYFFPIHPPVCR